MNLRERIFTEQLPTFDYATIGDENIEQLARTAAQKIREMHRVAAVDIGRELNAVKERLPHGKFIQWIEAEFGFGRRTAVNMMHVASEFGSNWETVSHLPSATLYKLAAPSTPADVRTAVLETLKPGQVISPQGVKLLINEAHKSAARKGARSRRDEIRAEQEAYKVRWEVQSQRARLKYEAEREIAKAAAERLKSMLGHDFAELSNLLAKIEPSLFGSAIAKLAESYRASHVMGDRP